MNAQVLFKVGVVCLLCAVQHSVFGIITTLSRNDPVPPYTADSPFALLGTRHNEYLKNREEIDDNRHISIELLPFYQWAGHGTNACGSTAELGDICGRWNMIALLPYNTSITAVDEIPVSTNVDLPCGQTFPTILTTIRNQLIPQLCNDVSTTDPTKWPTQLTSVQGLLALQQTSSGLLGNFGYFKVPMTYKKRGIRFNIQLYLGKGLGGTMQIGFADISQCATFTDMTPTTSGTGYNPFTTLTTAPKPVTGDQWKNIVKDVSSVLMSKLDAITTSTQIDQSICPFNCNSIEDFNGEVFWRYPVQINKDLDTLEYPKFLFIPFVAFGGTYAESKCKNPNQLTSLPFGDNGHNALRVRGGFSIDFYDTVEISFEAGGTFFKDHCYCNVPIPTNEYQHPIYPFRTDVRVNPGSNWHLAVGMYAFNFSDKWSCSFDYVYVSHDKDKICLLKSNTAAGEHGDETTCRNEYHPFKPSVIECCSGWNAQVINASLMYALSPNFSWGAMMQFPIKRRGTYRSTTFAASLYINV